MKKRPLNKIKADVWKVCSIYIRQKHADNLGYCKCYTCGVKKHWKEIQAGHGFSGRRNSILFETSIIRPQCFGCNVMNHGRLHIFTHKLREELGDERYEELYKQQFTTRIFTRDELHELLEHFKGGTDGLY